MRAQDYDPGKILEEEAKYREQERDLLSQLLDKQMNKAKRFFALKARMGGTTSYITVAPLSWVESNIRFASDLPLFENYSDTKEISINKNIDKLQHKIDWRRQLPMTAYLAERENYKFPPLLIVAYQKWAYQERHESDNWDIEGRAMRPSIYTIPLDSNGYFIDITDEDTNYYVIDGQHRLMAIKGLRDLLVNRRLTARDKNGKNKTKGGIYLTEIIDSLIERRKNMGDERTNKMEVHEWLQGKLSETIGIEIIPAVQTGETREEATTRLRQIFANVN